MLCEKCYKCGLCDFNNISQKSKNPLITTSLFFDECKISNTESDFNVNDIGIAIDVGTTTVVCYCFSLKDKKFLSLEKELNCQQKFGFDVISRINFAISSEQNYKLIRKILIQQLEKMISKCVQKAQMELSAKRISRLELKKIVICGNTTMESFVAGVSVKGLSVFPFKTESDFDFWTTSENIFGKDSILSGKIQVYFPPVVSAFAGSDILCALSTLRLDNNAKMFIDAGTNCELALYDGATGHFLVASTPAGPAFEGFGIEKGSSAVEGAIDKVAFKNGQLDISVIGGQTAKTICGSGVMSCIDAMLAAHIIDSKGTFDQSNWAAEQFSLTDEVFVCQKDIRSFQLAKSALAAAILTLLKESKVSVEHTYLAGGFLSSKNLESAVNIGLIPSSLSKNVSFTGNAAASGAILLLLEDSYIPKIQNIRKNCSVVDLTENSFFNEQFIQQMDFN